MSNYYSAGREAALLKFAVSKELAQRALLSRGLKEGLGDLLSASGGGKTLDKVHNILKQFPKTIRRAGSEARRMIYGHQPQFKMQPPISSQMAWKPDLSVFRNWSA